jgi:hypothetical protein
MKVKKLTPKERKVVEECLVGRNSFVDLCALGLWDATWKLYKRKLLIKESLPKVIYTVTFECKVIYAASLATARKSI